MATIEKTAFAQTKLFLQSHTAMELVKMYEGWNFNSCNYLFTTDTK